MFNFTHYRLFKLISFLVPLCLIVSFQNCTMGFNSTELSSAVGSVETLEQLQSKAIVLLTTNCQACHIQQGLGGVSDIANINHLLATRLVVPGDLNSPLMESIDNNSMPPSGPLSETHKRDLRNWILALGGQGPIVGAIDLSFDFNISFDPLIFPNRLNKLSYIIGSNPGTSLNAFMTNRFLLGDYNFSSNVIPNYSWSATDKLNWAESLQSFCSSSNFLNQYIWLTAAETLMERAYGRRPDSQDMTILNEINAINNINDQERTQILCLTLLTSMEFISK